MDSTNSPQLIEDSIRDDVKELMELPEEDRHDLLLLMAGMTLAKSLTTKKE